MRQAFRPSSASKPTVSALRRLQLVTAAIVPLAACSKINDVTGSIGQNASHSTQTAMNAGGPASQRQLTELGQRYERRPTERRNVIDYANALRSVQRHEQAIAVLRKAVLAKPQDRELLTAYGKALADARRFSEALQALERAQRPEQPDWSILSTQGSIADQSGNHAQARQYYEEALKLAPGEPRILSNLGLSLALNKQLPEAERVLRQAAAHPRADLRIRQNLSLVLALQGKFDEAETIQRQVLGPEDAKANIASIRAMIAQSNTWRDIQNLDRPPQKPARNARPARRS